MDRPTTGLAAVDQLLDGLRTGDNVVWQAPASGQVEPFLDAFLAAQATAPLAYVSFRLPPAAVVDRFRNVWDPERFLLVDGWTNRLDARSGGADTSARDRAPVRVRQLSDPADADRTDADLAGVEDELGQGARYVFDDLTGMQRLWGAEAALALFLRCCPRLYEQRTVACWVVERGAHQPAFLSHLAGITQVVLDLDGPPAQQTLQVAKADGRQSDLTGRILRYQVGDDGVEPVPGLVLRDPPIGQQVRAQRLAKGLSQAELASQVGVTPSALSQVERGRHSLSGQSLTRLWAALGVPFGPAADPAPAPYQLARRGARQPRTLAPGLTAETVLQPSTGVAMHLLTAEPNSSGRGPVFDTKQTELVLIQDGVLELQLGQVTKTLQQGDAIQLTTQPVTGWRNPARTRARVLWMLLES